MGLFLVSLPLLILVLIWISFSVDTEVIIKAVKTTFKWLIISFVESLFGVWLFSLVGLDIPFWIIYFATFFMHIILE